MSLKTPTLFLLLLLPFFSVQAAESTSVVINEIAWMGTETSASDEWIELYNNSNRDINLEAWGLYEAGGTILIEPLTGIVKAKSYYLIERTDEATVLDVPASQEPTSWGGQGLNNNGEHLQLLDNNAIVIDEVNCAGGWFAGNNTTKQTMIRINPGAAGTEPENWATSQEPNGTPGAQNQATETRSLAVPEIGSLSSTTTTTTAESTISEVSEARPQIIEYPGNVFINEILPSPEGADAENEWIEIYNANDFEVDMAGWQIRDTAGAVKTYTFPENVLVKTKEFLLCPRTKTKITLQNIGDTLELLNPAGEIVHKATYPKAPKGQSFNRSPLENSFLTGQSPAGWAWSATLTPAKENIISEPASPNAYQPESRTLANAKQKEATALAALQTKTGLADISQNLAQKSSRFLTILLAIIIAIGSAVIVLFLKKKITSEQT